MPLLAPPRTPPSPDRPSTARGRPRSGQTREQRACGPSGSEADVRVFFLGGGGGLVFVPKGSQGSSRTVPHTARVASPEVQWEHN